MIVSRADKLLAAFKHAVRRDVERRKRACCRAFAFVYKSQQEMLAANIVMSHAARRILRQCQRLFCAFAASIAKSLYISSFTP